MIAAGIRFLLVATCCIGACVLVGCGKVDESTSPSLNNSPTSQIRAQSIGLRRIAMMPKLVGLEYYSKAKLGAEEAAKELGIELSFDGPSEDKVELQAQMIDRWTASGMNAIAVAPNDPYVIAPSMRRAAEKNVLTITWDSDANVAGSRRKYFVNQAPARAIAETLVDLMAEGIGREGKTVIVSGSERSPNQATWVAEMKKVIEMKYPKIHLLEILFAGEDQDRARELTRGILRVHPDLKGIWGITSVALPGVAEAVKNSGKSGQVFVTGLSLPSRVKSFVNDGTISHFVLWNPIDLGYLTIHVATRALDGTIQQGTNDFGRLKGIQVVGDEVILGSPVVFDKSSIDFPKY